MRTLQKQQKQNKIRLSAPTSEQRNKFRTKKSDNNSKQTYQSNINLKQRLISRNKKDETNRSKTWIKPFPAQSTKKKLQIINKHYIQSLNKQAHKFKDALKTS